MGADDITKPDYQLGSGCLVDQLVGQYMAHVVGLGYLVQPERVKTTLASILKYNRRTDLHAHFNPLRSFARCRRSGAADGELSSRAPANPFPYFGEVMTGFEYTAAVGMLYEGMTGEGLQSIRDIRARYDGLKRNPFDEAECGHHYARAMASWAAVLALTGFRYSAVTRELSLAGNPGRIFWSTGYAWGTGAIAGSARQGWTLTLDVIEGRVALGAVTIDGARAAIAPERTLDAGESLTRGGPLNHADSRTDRPRNATRSLAAAIWRAWRAAGTTTPTSCRSPTTSTASISTAFRRWARRSCGCARIRTSAWKSTTSRTGFTGRRCSCSAGTRNSDRPPSTQHARERARRLFEQREEWWQPAAAKAGPPEHHVPVIYRIGIRPVTGRRADRPGR